MRDMRPVGHSARIRRLAAVVLLGMAWATFGVSPDAEAQSSSSAPFFQPGDPVFRSGHERAEEALLRRSERRNDPVLRAERRASRDAFKDLDRSGAWSLAKRKFPDFVGRSDGSPLRLSSGLRAVEPLDETTVRLETATGNPAGIAVSSAPVATLRDGRLELVDLSFVAERGTLSSRRPAIDVRYPRVASGAVALAGGGVSFRPVGATAVDSVAETTELFFPDALPGDTDYALVPKPQGVEAFWQLRSQASPESVALEFDLPPGARLRLADDVPGGAEVVAADGSTLAAVTPPMAFDADGTSISLTTAVDGSRLVMQVPHRGKDVAYPILVDPLVYEYWSRPVPGQARRLRGLRYGQQQLRRRRLGVLRVSERQHRRDLGRVRHDRFRVGPRSVRRAAEWGVVPALVRWAVDLEHARELLRQPRDVGQHASSAGQRHRRQHVRVRGRLEHQLRLLAGFLRVGQRG